MLYIWYHRVYNLLGLEFFLNINIWRFIQVVMSISSLFLLIAKYIPLYTFSYMWIMV